MIRFAESRWVFCALVAVMAGCAPASDVESRGSQQSKLNQPEATIVAPASEATTNEFGIVEWRVVRSKKELHLTGYDDNGKAVKGITTGFVKSTVVRAFTSKPPRT